MGKLLITTELIPKQFYPVDYINALDGVECEIVDNTAIIIVDTNKYDTASSIFHLGRFVELRIANKQLKEADKLINMLLDEKKDLRKANKDNI